MNNTNEAELRYFPCTHDCQWLHLGARTHTQVNSFSVSGFYQQNILLQLYSTILQSMQIAYKHAQIVYSY